MQNKGFSLIEIMVTIGLFAILVSMGLILSMDVWRGTSIQNEQDIVIALLYKARSRALANINESAHGFYIDADNEDGPKYWVFEGETFDEDNAQDFEMSEAVEFSFDESCDGNQVVFSAREARTVDCVFTMTGQGKTREFTVNNEGGITWLNINE